jgi:hypothetical protein
MGVKGGVGSGVRGNSNRIPDTKQPRLRVNRIIGVSRQDRAVSSRARRSARGQWPNTTSNTPNTTRANPATSLLLRISFK